MRLALKSDINRLNEIANNPAVYPFMVAEGKVIDFSNLFDDIVVFMSDSGFISFSPIGKKTWAFHSAFLPEGRGKEARNLARFAALKMFSKTECEKLITQTHVTNPKASPPLSFGFRKWFSSNEYQWYSLSIEDWAIKSPECKSLGELFHKKLDKLNHKSHDDDETHDRFVGAAISMILNGQVKKGLAFYNVWAVCAGYAEAIIESDSPLKINTGDAVWLVDLKNQTWEIEKCLRV